MPLVKAFLLSPFPAASDLPSSDLYAFPCLLQHYLSVLPSSVSLHHNVFCPGPSLIRTSVPQNTVRLTSYMQICHKFLTWLKMLYFINLHIQVIDTHSLVLQHFHWTAPGPKLCPFSNLSSAFKDLHIHARVSSWLRAR